MFMCANSGQNKLNVNEKEKKLAPIYIREKNLVSRQFTCTCSKNITMSIKNDVHILKLFSTVTTRKSLAFVSQFMKKKLIFWYCYFLGRQDKLHHEK